MDARGLTTATSSALECAHSASTLGRSRVGASVTSTQSLRLRLRPSSQLTRAKGSLTVQKQKERRRWAAPAAAQSQAVSEDSSEAPAAEAEAEAEAAPEARAAAEASFKSVAEALKAAVESGEEAAVSEVQAQVKALEEDREALAGALASAEDEIKKAKDRFLRLNADFDNFRKRSEREKSQLAASVRGDVVEALLPMVDSFERAKSALKLETDAERRIDSSYQGIYKQFVEVMKGFGVAAVETVGKEFDPQVHEAIMREESLEFPEGVVVQEFRKGFVIGDRLVRPAMVKVSSGPGPSDTSDAADGAISEASGGEESE